MSFAHRLRLLAALVLLVAPLRAGERKFFDRVAWETDQVMPLSKLETVRLRAITRTRGSIDVLTRVMQFSGIHDERVAQEILNVPGEQLTGASLQDLNDDGVQEVLLRFSPPRNQSLVRLIVLCFARRDRKYLKIWEEGPATGLSARWRPLKSEDRLERPFGLAVERRPEEASAGAPEVTTYAFRGEKLIELSRAPAAPRSPAEQLGWGIRWMREGKLARAQLALVAATPLLLDGEERARALHGRARIALALGDTSGARKALGELAQLPPAGPYSAAGKHLGELAARTGGAPGTLSDLVLAQLALDAGRHAEALAHSQKVLDDHRPPRDGQSKAVLSPWTDEALMVQAQVHMAEARTADSVRVLRAVMVACPESPLVPLAREWLARITGSPIPAR